MANHTTLRASLLMLVSAVVFGLMSVSIRLAAIEGLHAFEIAFFRNLFGLIFALPLLYQAGWALLKTDKLKLYFVRCAIGLLAMLTGFWSLVHLPLSQAIAISYTTPMFVTIGAVLVLGEQVRRRRWTAVAVGFLGTLVILKAWNFREEMLGTGAWIALLSAALAASAAISIKFLSRTEPANAIVIFMVLIMTPLSLIPAIPVWTWPSAWAWFWLVLTGLFGTLAHIALTKAYQQGDVSALTPINFVQLPVVSVFAWQLFGEVPDRYTLMGALIVFSASAYIAHREHVLARRAVATVQAESQAK